MVEKYAVPEKKRVKRRVMSPPSLPPRWGEGVAPPTTPHFSEFPSPETSPNYEINRGMIVPILNHPPHYPSTGAELLHDLHRRLQAQSVNGSLPRRPKGVYRSRTRTRTRRVKNNMPDLLPSSAWNHPSRHTLYQVLPEHTRIPSSSSSSKYILPTSDYSTSPSTSESPPLPVDPRTPPLIAPTLPLSFPSPPLQRRRSKRPLTSTMLASPPESTSSGSCRTAGHPTSPASPELSSIPASSTADETTYQNIAQE